MPPTTTSDPNLLSLADWASLHPDLWQGIVDDLKYRVKNNQAHTLGRLRHEAQTKISSLVTTPKSIGHWHDKENVKAQMTLLAIDQFSDAMTGKIGRKAPLQDRLVLSAGLLPFLSRGTCPGLRRFDQLWSYLKDPLWAAGELQRQGFWSVPSQEFLRRMTEHFQGRPVLEIGAGRGLLTSGLKKMEVNVTGIDDFTWQQSRTTVKGASGLIKMASAEEALRSFNPSVVICSWPPPDNNFEKIVFTTHSVDLYLAIVSKHRFAAGTSESYRQQQSFTCSTSEVLNRLLRPLELEQQVLIFRRKKPS